MPHHHPDAAPRATTRRVFRQPSAYLTGWIFIAGLAIACILFLIQDPGNWAEPVVLCGLIGLVVWVLLVRPDVVVAKDGVVLHNLVRDVTIPWAHVDLTTRRWNLKVYTPEGDKYGSWAISQQRPRRQRDTVGDAGIGMMPTPGRFKNPGKVNTTIEERDSSAEAVGSLIDQTKEEYDRMIRTGELKVSPDPVQVAIAVPAVAALAVSVVLLVICVLLFS